MQTQTPIYGIANEFAHYTQRSVFITGNAGTGKTTFLRKLKETTSKQMAVVAPTGVAAINAGGATIHSFFQLPFTPFIPTIEGEINLMSKIKMTSMRRRVIQELELLVIDEISMVRADLLDEIDTVLRYIRYRKNVPFGGVQVIFIGDLYQLPPVVTPEVWDTISPFYEGPYFFNSRVVQKQPPTYIEFDTIFRQTDLTFINLLNEVRLNRLSTESFQLLAERYNPHYQITEGDNSILLTTHNAKAERINLQELAKIKAPIHTFSAEIMGEFPEKNYPNDAKLDLKEGAKVMFIANDSGYPRRYFNGKIGVIAQIDSEKKVFVACEGEEELIPVGYEVWENIQYTVNKKTKQIEEKLLGSYRQIPLRLAWAITIHKSQGLTFDKVVIDAEAAFSSGQTYVALSRCRSLEGVTLLSPIYRSSLLVADEVKEYSNHKPSLDLLTEELSSEKELFNRKVLLDLFDFTACKGLIAQIYEQVTKDVMFFSPNASSFILEIYQKVGQLQQVAERFQKQICSLIESENYEQLGNRVEDASVYFTEQLDLLLQDLRSCKVETDYKDAANAFNDLYLSLFGELSRQKHIIKNVNEDYSAEHLFALKKQFRMPQFSINIYKNHFETPKKQKKSKNVDKTPKKPSSEITYELFKEGKCIEAISAERNLAISTIESHLTDYIKKGKISLEELDIPVMFVEIAKDLFLAGEDLSSVFNSMEGNLTYGQLRMIRASMTELSED